MGLISLHRVSRLFLALSLLALSGNLATAQQSTQLAFEAASIRPAHVSPGCYSTRPPGGTQYAVSCITLRELIALAWELRPDNIQSSNSGALGKYYDLRAVTPGDQRWTLNSIPPMLRQLLIERFHIAAHPGTVQISGYALVVAKGGSKLTPSDIDTTQQGHKAGESYQNYILPGYIHSPGANLDVIASLLSSPADATVVDDTGMSGVFKVDLHFSPEGSTESNWPDFFTAIKDQLGLELKPKKVSVKSLVIDHVDDEPVAN